MNANWILNKDQSIYHLSLKQDQLAKTIILVGDPDRVGIISNYFDTIEFKNSSREFVCHSGFLQNKKITVLSTGIGTDNIDIVLNELDALFNYDPQLQKQNENLCSLDIIRIGTSGAIQEEIELDSFIIAKSAVGLDGLMNYYKSNYPKLDEYLLNEFNSAGIDLKNIAYSESNQELYQHFSSDQTISGCCLTAAGFYAPQGREVRIPEKHKDLLLKLSNLQLNEIGKITNIEMETSGIYALSQLMGHRSISLNAILANRITNRFSQDPQRTIKKLIEYSLEKIIDLDGNQS